KNIVGYNKESKNNIVFSLELIFSIITTLVIFNSPIAKKATTTLSTSSEYAEAYCNPIFSITKEPPMIRVLSNRAPMAPSFDLSNIAMQSYGAQKAQPFTYVERCT